MLEPVGRGVVRQGEPWSAALQVKRVQPLEPLSSPQLLPVGLLWLWLFSLGSP